MTTKTKKKKIIPAPVDVKGKSVTWVGDDGFRYFGTVQKVFFRHAPHDKYPDSCLRKLVKFMTIHMPDDRVLTVSADHYDLKRMKMVTCPEI